MMPKWPCRAAGAVIKRCQREMTALVFLDTLLSTPTPASPTRFVSLSLTFGALSFRPISQDKECELPEVCDNSQTMSWETFARLSSDQRGATTLRIVQCAIMRTRRCDSAGFRRHYMRWENTCELKLGLDKNKCQQNSSGNYPRLGEAGHR